MGTRADFYTKTEKEMTWLGSIAWDGYPDGIPAEILKADNSELFTTLVNAFIASRNDGTKPEQGWPWPWNDSNTTDFAYVFTPENKVVGYNFGSGPFDPTKDGEDEDQEIEKPSENPFPDMTAIQNVDMGARSGVIVLGG